MRPIQVWLPHVSRSPHHADVRSDIGRAFQQWNFEQVVFFAPNVHTTFRWDELSIRAMALQTEHANRVDIYHCGENRFVAGPLSTRRFPSGNIDGLLDLWLNLETDDLWEPPDKLTVPWPEDLGNRVKMVDAAVEFSRAHLIPVEDFTRDVSTLKWPPGGHLFPNSVSMEAESFQYFEHMSGRLPHYGPIHWGTASFLYAFRAVVFLAPEIHFGVRSPRLEIPQVLRYDREGYIILGVLKAAPRWGETFAPMFPTGGGLDDLLARRTMAEVARLSATKLNDALERVKTEAAPYISETWIPKSASWLGPTAVGGQVRGDAEGAILTEAESRFGVSFANLDEARKSSEWESLLASREKVTRVWGVTGLFWALLIERLDAGRRFGQCDRCGRIIHGRKGKKYCGPGDDPDCYRRRRAADKRRGRDDR